MWIRTLRLHLLAKHAQLLRLLQFSLHKNNAL
ncbi:hypothetical protein O6H91_18G068300 [Diphasiastrum complanatum]|uniref:Uncharacterized protein n=1 Tax=Diphasiastrum complanatum TaxID=34168 RepID=A0ACC2B2D7_DIPCM|nr:hypothetical protein O6H91_18G068300 [Diphasiastrum complanatum]